MDKKEVLDKIIDDLIESQLSDYDVNLNSPFTGVNSIIKSIDIMSSISFIEDELEKDNIFLMDLFEKIFEEEELTFLLLKELIYKLIKNK